MKRILTTTSLLAFLAFAACNTTPNTTPEQITQTKPNAASKVLGVIEVEISSSDGSISSAKILGVNANGNLQAKGTAVAISNGNFVLTPGTSTYMTDGTYKYFQNTLSFNNKTGTSFSNLAMYPVSLPSSVGGTAFTAVSTLGGVPLTGTAASDLARATLPTHGMSSTTTVDPNKADLMLYTPAEAATVKSQLTVAPFTYVNPTVLEYGFLGRNLTGGRAIASSTVACPTCGKGTVTWAFKFPLSLANSSNLGKFSFRYVIVDEPGSFGVQSVEEQAAGTIGGVSTGAASSLADWRTLGGTGLTGVKVNPICGAVTANSIGSGQAFLGTARVSGELDPCFFNGGKQTLAFGATSTTSVERIQAAAIQPDGKIVVAGFTNSTGTSVIVVARFNRDGTLDTGFGKQLLQVSVEDWAYAVAIQPDGKILVAGETRPGNDFAVVRFNSDGTLDSTFAVPGSGLLGAVKTNMGGSDVPSSMFVQPDGKIVVAGRSDDNFAIARYNTNGSLDTTGFGTGGKVLTDIGGNDNINAIALQTDGKIVAAGYTYGDGDFAVARYNSNGSLDTSFGTTGIITTAVGYQDQAHGVVIQTDGKIVVGGLSGFYPDYDFALVRYNTNGSLDTAFGSSGITLTDFTGFGYSNDQGRSLALQADGKIVLAGIHGTAGTLSTFDFAMARYNTNGSLDTSFGSSGKAVTDFLSGFDSNTALVIPSNGRIVSVGYAADGSGLSDDLALARFNP